MQMVLQPSFLIFCSVGIGQPLDLSLLSVPKAKIPWCLSWMICSGLAKRLSRKPYAFPFPDPSLGVTPHSGLHQTDNEADTFTGGSFSSFPPGTSKSYRSPKCLHSSIPCTPTWQTPLAWHFESVAVFEWQHHFFSGLVCFWNGDIGEHCFEMIYQRLYLVQFVMTVLTFCNHFLIVIEA